MFTVDDVEKLRRYGNISFEDANRALSETEGNMLDAVLLLEKEGKIPKSGGTSESDASPRRETDSGYYQETTSFATQMGRFFSWVGEIIKKGVTNTFKVEKNNEVVVKIPIIALVLLLMFFFWIIVPLIILGLFFDFRYSFHGPDLGTEYVNGVVDKVAEAADGIKNTIKDTKDETKDGKDTDN